LIERKRERFAVSETNPHDGEPLLIKRQTLNLRRRENDDLPFKGDCLSEFEKNPGGTAIARQHANYEINARYDRSQLARPIGAGRQLFRDDDLNTLLRKNVSQCTEMCSGNRRNKAGSDSRIHPDCPPQRNP